MERMDVLFVGNLSNGADEVKVEGKNKVGR